MQQYDELCDKIRAFNRFYTVKMDFLNTDYLGANYTIAETRVLFEIKNRKNCMQSEIAKDLHIDKSYLSRIIRRFKLNGLVQTAKSSGDKRAEIISLTELGNTKTEELINLTNVQINFLISKLNKKECKMLADAVDTIIAILGKENV